MFFVANIGGMKTAKDHPDHPDPPISTVSRPVTERLQMLSILRFVDEYSVEVSGSFEASPQNPYLNMTKHLIHHHLEGKLVTATSLIGASGVPYTTATRRLQEMIDDGLIEQRPRTKTGKSFSLHPSATMIHNWTQFCQRLRHVVQRTFGTTDGIVEARDYYYGRSYMASTKSIEPLPVLNQPIVMQGGLRLLVPADPTFMAMEGLNRQLGQIIGSDVIQRAYSIDRLRDEVLANAHRDTSRYDIVAVDVPWMGEFVEKDVLLPLNEVMDTQSLEPDDFHVAGWHAAHYGGHLYGVPNQTSPELLFYRLDRFRDAGLKPPHTTDELLKAAAVLHQPEKNRYGIAWNAARGTALGHTFIMTCADFDQPVVDMEKTDTGYDAFHLQGRPLQVTIDTPNALKAAEYLMALMEYSPPDILSMSWYERVRQYGAGDVAMAYGYTAYAPYFELDPESPAYEQTGYLPHPSGNGIGRQIAPIGGFILGIPRNLPAHRQQSAAAALAVLTSAEAQKLYVMNGGRTAPRYSVGSDPEVTRLSSIFSAVDTMSWREELQYWPRPPVPQITPIIDVCGEVFHEMLRGLITPKQALIEAQDRAEKAVVSMTTAVRK